MRELKDADFSEITKMRAEYCKCSLGEYRNPYGFDDDEVNYFFERFDLCTNYDMEADNWDNLEEYFKAYKND